MRSRRFTERVGAFYEGIKTESKVTLSYRFIFILRRLSFCLLIFGLESNCLKACFLFFQNMLYTIYICNFKPKEGRLFQNLDMINELLIQTVTVHLFPLQDLMGFFDDEEKIKYDVAYSMSSFLTLLEIVNVVVVLRFMMKELHLVFVKYYRRLDWEHLKLTNTFLIYCLGYPKPTRKVLKKKKRKTKKSIQ